MRRSALLMSLAVLGLTRASRAEAPLTPGYPEPVVQWGSQKGETCAQIANALYGSPKYAHLLLRYNRISCGGPLDGGLTLVAPARVTTAATARMRSMQPEVQTRPSGGAWQPASTGQQLDGGQHVETREKGRADIEFTDRTRIFLAPHTLVVLFDTAAQTRVKKVTPPKLEVQQGEVQAGLAALRGESVEVAVPDSGRISAQSRATVVARQNTRTTVAVFEGKAQVSSAGKSVEVPTNFGTRFLAARPPDPPRPLPTAPTLAAAPPIALAPDGLLTASWSAVPGAASYRVEVSRDADFSVPIVREEVPASITAFRGEHLPAGSYHVRVRAIDKEDYLGVAATRSQGLITATVRGGQFHDGRLVVRDGAQIVFAGPPGTEVTVDEGAFVPLPPVFRLPSPLVHRVKLRAGPEQPPIEVAVEPEPLRGVVAVRSEAPGRVRVELQPDGFSVDEAMAMAPRVRVSREGAEPRDIALAALDREHLGVVLPAAPGEVLNLEVVDATGAVLATSRFEEPRPVAATSSEAPTRILLPPPSLGTIAPVWAHQLDAAPPWSLPRVTTNLSVSAVVSPAGGAGSLLDVRGGGSLGPVDIDGALRTRLGGDVATDGLARVGVRTRLPRIGSSALTSAVLLHAQLPTTDQGPAPAVEPSVAVGGASAAGHSWGAQAGGRVRVTSNDSRVPTAGGLVFAQVGGAFRLGSWWRVVGVVDGRRLVDASRGDAWRAGGSLGVEVGRSLFAGLAVRGGLGERSDEGAVTGQLTLGVRE